MDGEGGSLIPEVGTPTYYFSQVFLTLNENDKKNEPGTSLVPLLDP